MPIDKVRQICSLYHIDPDLKRVCLSIILQEELPSAEYKIISGKIKGFFSTQKYFLAFQEELMCVLLFYPVTRQDLDAITQSSVQAISLFEHLKTQYPVRIGISCAHTGPETIHDCYTESMQSVAITTKTMVAGCATGASHFSDVEEAARFAVETAKYFTKGTCQFYDKDQFRHLKELYGSMEHLKTFGV